MHKKRPEVILVKWIDSHVNRGWQYESDCDFTVAQCETVGYFVSETKKTLTLAQSRARADGQVPWGELITIPKVAITKRLRMR